MDLTLRAAVDAFEGWTGRVCLTTNWRMKLWELPAGDDPIVLPKWPVTAVSLVEYTDDADAATDITSVTDLVDGMPNYVVPDYNTTWPTDERNPHPGNVTVEFTAGYADADSVPVEAKLAILQLTKLWFDARGGATEIKLHEVPFGLQNLLKSMSVGGMFEEYAP